MNNPKLDSHVGKAMLYLSKADIVRLGGDKSDLYMSALRRALTVHSDRDFVQPLKPYLRWRGEDNHIADRIIAMPVYIGGEQPMAGLKWVGSKHDNPALYHLDRASAVVVLNDPQTHFPVAVLEGSLISGMRTAAVTGVAASHLAVKDFERVSCLGCGPIARMQLITLLEQFPQIRVIKLFDLRMAAAAALREYLTARFPQTRIEVTDSAEAAVRPAQLLLTCTVADKPYIPFEWLSQGVFISNISIMDVEPDVFLKADKVIVDDWEQANREKKVLYQLTQAGLFSREMLYAELGELVSGKKPGRTSAEEIILLNPMGMAIEDIACAEVIYRKALAQDAGVWLGLD